MKIFLKISASVAMIGAYALLSVLQPSGWVTFVLGIPVCTWLANLVHELGHLAAYVLLKLQWKRLVFSFFVFDREKGVRFDGQRGIFAASCTCAYSPKVPLWRYRVALLSGGILGMILGIGALFSSLGSFLQCFGLISVLHGAITLLFPFTTDRKLLRQIRNERENLP